MTFDEFLVTCKLAIAQGKIRISKPLTELDFAIQYAVGVEMEQTGNNKFTAKDIYFLIYKHCGKEWGDKLFA